jgi:hypothetical protein
MTDWVHVHGYADQTTRYRVLQWRPNSAENSALVLVGSIPTTIALRDLRVCLGDDDCPDCPKSIDTYEQMVTAFRQLSQPSVVKTMPAGKEGEPAAPVVGAIYHADVTPNLIPTRLRHVRLLGATSTPGSATPAVVQTLPNGKRLFLAIEHLRLCPGPSTCTIGFEPPAQVVETPKPGPRRTAARLQRGAVYHYGTPPRHVIADGETPQGLVFTHNDGLPIRTNELFALRELSLCGGKHCTVVG